MIEDLDGVPAETSRLRVVRPRVSAEPTPWAFLSALGGGFIVGTVADIALVALWPMLVPPTQSHPEWLFPGAVRQATQFVAIGAVAMRAGGARALALSVGFEVTLILAQVPNRIAFCEHLQAPDPYIPCGLAAITLSTWPTWAALTVGVVASRQMLPTPTRGANTLLRAAGAFTLALTTVVMAWQLAQGAVFDTLSAWGWLGVEGPRNPSALVAIATIFLIVELLAGLLAGVLLRRAPSAAVLLFALLIGYAVGMGVALIRNNVDTGVPHVPLELAYLQAMNAITPAMGILGIALGRLLSRRWPVVRRAGSYA